MDLQYNRVGSNYVNLVALVKHVQLAYCCTQRMALTEHVDPVVRKQWRQRILHAHYPARLGY
jgi:hypothetical protein